MRLTTVDELFPWVLGVSVEFIRELTVVGIKVVN